MTGKWAKPSNRHARQNWWLLLCIFLIVFRFCFCFLLFYLYLHVIFLFQLLVNLLQQLYNQIDQYIYLQPKHRKKDDTRQLRQIERLESNENYTTDFLAAMLVFIFSHDMLFLSVVFRFFCIVYVSMMYCSWFLVVYFIS